MKPQLIIALVIFALIVVSAVTAPAYTYTCEEGRFAIDIPEGFKIDQNIEGILSVGNKNGLDVRVFFGKPIDFPIETDFSRWGSTEDFSIFDIHDALVNEKREYAKLIDERWLTISEANSMGVDSGFITNWSYGSEDYKFIDIAAVLLKGNLVYELYGVCSPQKNLDTVIKTLNSFRAID